MAKEADVVVAEAFSQGVPPPLAAALPVAPAGAQEAVVVVAEAAPNEEAAVAGPVQKVSKPKAAPSKAQAVALAKKVHKQTVARLGTDLTNLLADSVAFVKLRGGGGPDESFGTVLAEWRKRCADENAYRLQHDNREKLKYKDFDASHLKRRWTGLCDLAKKKPTSRGTMGAIVKRAHAIMKSRGCLRGRQRGLLRRRRPGQPPSSFLLPCTMQLSSVSIQKRVLA